MPDITMNNRPMALKNKHIEVLKYNRNKKVEKVK